MKEDHVGIGYACILMGTDNGKLRSCRLKNVNEETVLEIVGHNLELLNRTIEYNKENNIRLFRISSDIIPFASHPEMKVNWKEIFKEELKRIGEKIKRYEMRVTMHPGQYTVLNSPSEEVVNRAVDELKYHADFLDCLGMDSSGKLILHIGGIYENKELAMQRFIDRYFMLDDAIKRRLVIENDDKNYHIEDVLYISRKTNIPVIFDNLHHEINKVDTKKKINDYILECKKTWGEKDGRQKIHYSQQDPKKTKGAHSKTIRVNEFLEFYHALPHQDIDIMLEVKDKNVSALKCILCTETIYKIDKIEKEWAKYKYYVLGKDPKIYLKIRALLKNKQDNITLDFYRMVEEAIEIEINPPNEINAAQHVIGYFTEKYTLTEKNRLYKLLSGYLDGTKTLENMKTGIQRIAVKYDIEYINNSYYFLDL